MSSRIAKIISINFLVAVSYFLLLEASLPFRATFDEREPAVDIHTILSSGGITGIFEYSNGNLHQIYLSELILITGVPYMSTSEFISPIIAAIVISVLVFSIYEILNELSPNTNGDALWVALFIPSIFVFGGVLIRFIETSHKSLTYAVVFIGIYLSTKFVRRPNIRTSVLFLLIIISLPLYNYIWAIVYGPILLFPALASTDYIKQLGEYAIILILVSFSVATYLPTVFHNTRYFKVTVLLPLISMLQGANTTQTATKTGSLIGEWPSIIVLGTPISVWFIYTIGILIVGLLTIEMSIKTLLQTLQKKATPAEILTLSIISYSGIITVSLAAAGDIPTMKRTIFIPGIFAGGLWFIQKWNREQPDGLSRTQLFSIGVSILLIVASILAVPRVAIDGHNKPIDRYVDQNEIEKIQWLSSHGDSQCLKTHGNLDPAVSAKVTGEIIQPTPYKQGDTIVYSGGRNAQLTCNH